MRRKRKATSDAAFNVLARAPRRSFLLLEPKLQSLFWCLTNQWKKRAQRVWVIIYANDDDSHLHDRITLIDWRGSGRKSICECWAGKSHNLSEKRGGRWTWKHSESIEAATNKTRAMYCADDVESVIDVALSPALNDMKPEFPENKRIALMHLSWDNPGTSSIVFPPGVTPNCREKLPKAFTHTTESSSPTLVQKAPLGLGLNLQIPTQVDLIPPTHTRTKIDSSSETSNRIHSSL